MNRDAIRRFFMLLSSAVEVKRGSLYQLVGAAETSYYLRDMESQHEIALLLQSFGYPFSHVGKYYESIYLSRSGQNDKAKKLLECVADSAPAPYRSKALLSLAAVAERIGQFEESLRLRLQISSFDDPVTLLEAQRGMAARRGVEGEHQAALRELERMIPLAHIIGKRGHPAYVTFLNSYAVELSESNRMQEAEQVASVIAASPFIGGYPEWQDTLAEIAAKRKTRHSVSVSLPQNMISRNPNIQGAIAFINANIQRRILLPDIAKAVNFSGSHLSRLFKSEIGLSPIQYVIRLRIDKARQLITTTFLSLKQIMAEVGYNNRGDFNRHFKRRFGVSPSKYRKRTFIQQSRV